MNPIETWILAGKEAFIKGNLTEALENLTKAIQVDPSNKVALLNRANINYQAGNFLEAIDDYASYIKLNPQNAQAFCGKGKANLALLRIEKALEDFNQAIDLNPHYPGAYFSRSEYFKLVDNQERFEADQKTGQRFQGQISRALWETQGNIINDI